MTNSSVVYVRMDAELKTSAEDILQQLGITPSSAIQMLYRQIILQNGIPFALKLPERRPVAIGNMDTEVLVQELNKGINSINNHNLYTAEDIDKEFSEKLKD